MATKDRLDGWKAIAAHLNRDERTAMRWASERGLPIRRPPGSGRGPVYAFTAELDGWLRSSEPSAAPSPAETTEPPRRLDRRRWWPLIAGIALIAIGVTLAAVPRRETPAPPRPSTDPAAKALYEQATFDWNLRTKESLARAVDEYSRAIGRDPGMADAYVGLANSYLLLREYGALPDAEAYARAESAAKAALAIDPTAANMHRLRGFLAFWWHGDTELAGREFRRAIALAPNDALSHHWYANALSANGEADAALQEIVIARDLDPTSVSILSDIGSLDYLSGHRAQGLALLRKLELQQPQDLGLHRALADFALFEGNGVEFLREADDMVQRRGDAHGAAIVARLKSIPPQDIRAIMTSLIDQVKAKADSQPDGYYQLARVYAVSGAAPEALAALSKACARREIATFGAPGNLWLSRSLDKAQITSVCGSRGLL